MKLADFDYYLPSDLIAQKPVVPRDSSRIFIYDTKNDKIVFDRFYNLDKYLPKNSFLVLNNTKVLPARIELKKSTGGKVICLLLINELTPLRLAERGFEGQANSRIIKAMVDRKVKVGERLFIDKEHFFTVVDQKDKIFYLSFDFNRDWLLKQLYKIGKTPVPLYLRKTPLSEKELREKYQTIFSFTPEGCRLGSVAAPTASLHFTNRVLGRLEKKGIKKLFITLHVGLGTFAPILEENIKEKKLHEEYFEINPETTQLINQLSQDGKKLVAVGTTVTRALESISKIKDQRSKIKDQRSKIKDQRSKIKIIY